MKKAIFALLVSCLAFACSPASEQTDDADRDYMMDDDMMEEDEDHMMDEDEMHDNDSLRNRDMMTSTRLIMQMKRS